MSESGTRGVASPVCRLCGSADTRELGVIPDSDYFAGQVLERALTGGRLWRCEQCASMFRHPVLTDEEYLSLYRSGKPEQWSSEAREGHWNGSSERQDLQTIRAILSANPVRSVLDVGCGSGEFLASLPADVARCGIEPCGGAAELAIRRGVEIVAPELQGCDPTRRFDAVTVIDVIEHIARPEPFLSRAYQLLSPEGLLIVSTGDPANRLWRGWLQARFWYAAFPEHISFPSSLFFQWWCARVGGRLLGRHSVYYQRAAIAQRLAGAAIQMAFALSPGAFNWLGRLTRSGLSSEPRRRTFSPGVPGAFRDHQVLVARKSAS